MDNDGYMVATLCMTYNHAPYIEEALHGFCIQETSSPVAFIVIDDASTDGESDVLKEWVNDNLVAVNNDLWEKKPYGKLAVGRIESKPLSTFVILLLSENHYSPQKSPLKLEYVSQWSKNAKYLAICEGDDYWICPTKLKEQIDCLEENENVGLCYTNSRVYIQSSGLEIEPFPHPYNGVESLICQNPIMTLTTLFRRDLFYQYRAEIRPDEHNWEMGDYPMWIWLAVHSDVIYIDKVTSVYRKLDNSASHSSDVIKRIEFIDSINDVRMFFLNRYFPNNKELIAKVEDDRYRRLANAYDEMNERTNYIKYTKMRRDLALRTRIRLMISASPFTYKILKFLKI